MIFAIISDIHANEIALSAVLDDAKSLGAQRIICLGDVVGYGPAPEKAVAIIRRSATATVAGNHDDAVAGRLDPEDFIDLAADAAARHHEALSADQLAWLKSLPYVFEGNGFACAHGDFTAPSSFEYVADESSAAENFAARSEALLFVGHTHVPGIFLTGASGRVYSLAPTDFTIEDGKRYIVNPGSVGYPRTDGSTCESTYVLYDDELRTVTFRRLPFTVRSVMQTGRNPKRMKKRIVAAIAAVAAAAAGLAAWMLTPGARTETITEVVTNRVETIVEKEVAIAHNDRSAECALPKGCRKVQISVKLAKGSPPAQLQLVFQDAAGNTLGDVRWTVKRSKKTAEKVPAGAIKAILNAGRGAGDAPATFDSFVLTPL